MSIYCGNHSKKKKKKFGKLKAVEQPALDHSRWNDLSANNLQINLFISSLMRVPVYFSILCKPNTSDLVQRMRYFVQTIVSVSLGWLEWTG